MKLTSGIKGEIAQLKVQLEATKKNLISSIPCTEVRYDLVIDSGKSIQRAQIKYADITDSKNTLKIKLHGPRTGKKFYTNTEIDILLLFIPKLDKILKYDANFFHKRKNITINLKHPASPYFWKKHLW